MRVLLRIIKIYAWYYVPFLKLYIYFFFITHFYEEFKIYSLNLCVDDIHNKMLMKQCLVIFTPKVLKEKKAYFKHNFKCLFQHQKLRNGLSLTQILYLIVLSKPPFYKIIPVNYGYLLPFKTF